MILRSPMRPQHSTTRCATGGFTLVELMVAMAISLLILLALVGLFVNTSRSNTEMARTNALIENGRFAIQLLQNELVHAGFWSGYIPQFDDIGGTDVAPGDVPAAVPDPCATFGNWNIAYRNAFLGIPVQAYATRPTGVGCDSPLAPRAGSDALVVRHADTCGLQWDTASASWVPAGGSNCEAVAAGRPYFQYSRCTPEKDWAPQSAAAETVQLPLAASTIDDDFVDVTVRVVRGLGAGQFRRITAYDGATRTATVSPGWNTIPDSTSILALEYALGTVHFPLNQRGCFTSADLRRVISHIYYVSDFPHPERAGEVIPALVRSELDVVGGVLAQQAPVRLIDGIEALRVELGVDNLMTRLMTCGGPASAVDYGAPVSLTTNACNPAAQPDALPVNRGDGAPDTFVRCTTAAPCTAAQLTDVVAVKLYVLARSRDRTPGYTDSKTFCLGEPNADGSCPAANSIAAAADGYKRHVFSTSVRLTNISGRRETP